MSQPNPRRQRPVYDRRNQHLPHADPRRAPVGDRYDEMVPRQGYTVPYQAPPVQPRPTGFARWQQYYQNLRQKARANSMSWWLMKALQGILFGGPLLALGTSLLILNAVSLHDGLGVPLLSLFLILVGLRYIIYYGLAPWLQKWIVTVPDKHYHLIIQRGKPIEYLPPGPLHVPFRFNSQIVEYVDFQSVHAKDVYEDILQGHGPPITLEVGVMMAFNPVEADPRHYEQLRSMNRAEQFRRVIADTTYEALMLYLEQFEARHWPRALMNQAELTRYLTESMWSLAVLGLTPAGGQPVTVFVQDHSAPPQVRPHPVEPAEPTQAHPFAPPSGFAPSATVQSTVPTADLTQRAVNNPVPIEPTPPANEQPRRVRRVPIGAEPPASNPAPEHVPAFTNMDAGAIPPFEDADLADFTGTEDPTIVGPEPSRPPTPSPDADAPTEVNEDTPVVREAPPNTWIRPHTRRRHSDTPRSKPKLPLMRPPERRARPLRRAADESRNEEKRSPDETQNTDHTPPFGTDFRLDASESEADDNT